MRDIDIPEDGLAGIRSLLDLGADGIARFREAIEATGPTLLSPRSRSILIEEAMGQEHVVDIERILAFALHPLFLLRQTWEASPQELHSSVAQSLSRAKANWDQSDTKRWIDFEHPLIALLGSEVAQIEAKAESLLRQRANRVQSTRIFSDSRPVFDDERIRVSAVLLIDTLRIRYRDGDESRVMHFALDKSDLDELEQQIARAKGKHCELARLNRELELPTLGITSEVTQVEDADQEQ